MIQEYWFAMALFAVGTTYLWAYRTERIVLSSAFSAASWIILALTGDQIVKHDNTGAEVSAPIEPFMQYFLAALGLLALLALGMYIVGAYPPEADDLAQNDTQLQ